MVGNDGSGFPTIGWKDNINLFLSSARGKGLDDPSWEDIGNGIWGWNFAQGDELFFMFHVNHDYMLGTNCYPHVHWMSNDAIAIGEGVDWTIEYTIARGYSRDSLLGIPTPFTLSFVASEPYVAGIHHVTEASDNQAFDLIEPDTLVSGIVRLSTKNVSGDVFGLLLDLHYQSNREHTPNRNFPFGY